MQVAIPHTTFHFTPLPPEGPLTVAVNGCVPAKGTAAELGDTEIVVAVVTVSVAVVLGVLPALSLTVTVKLAPLSLTLTAGIVSVAPVAPEILEEFRNHW